MAHAYASFASGGEMTYGTLSPGAAAFKRKNYAGTVPGPVGIREILEPRGDGKFRTARLVTGGKADNETKSRRVLSEDVARTTEEILQGVVRLGSGKRATLGPEVMVAGKTGTTENYGDAWFVGWTERYTVAVWVGYPDSVKPMEPPTFSFNGEPVAGGTYPAAIWGTFMQQAMDIYAREHPEETEELAPDTAPTPGVVTAPSTDTGAPVTTEGGDPAPAATAAPVARRPRRRSPPRRRRRAPRSRRRRPRRRTRRPRRPRPPAAAVATAAGRPPAAKWRPRARLAAPRRAPRTSGGRPAPCRPSRCRSGRRPRRAAAPAEPLDEPRDPLLVALAPGAVALVVDLDDQQDPGVVDVALRPPGGDPRVVGAVRQPPPHPVLEGVVDEATSRSRPLLGVGGVAVDVREDLLDVVAHRLLRVALHPPVRRGALLPLGIGDDRPLGVGLRLDHRNPGGHGRETCREPLAQKRHGSSAALVIPIRTPSTRSGASQPGGGSSTRTGPVARSVVLWWSSMSSAWVSLPAPSTGPRAPSARAVRA
jgi:hypothetical protein